MAYVYTIHGVLITKFSIFGEHTASNMRVMECQFWGDGLVAMASDFQLYAVEVRVDYHPSSLSCS
jgi:hypothetical protein